MAAAANKPGARYSATSWVSGGKLYLFGGTGYVASGAGYLNDLWEYDPATNNWRWLKGSNTISQLGTYGTLGVAAAANTPGARQFATSWESGGKLYLFGGYGYAASGGGSLNNLWEYDPVTNNWRWLKGSNDVDQMGTYGTLGVAAAVITPGARQSATSWESGGKLYLFGGYGYATSGSGSLNDLWEYDPATNNWRWFKGSNTINQVGTYGTLGVATSANTPGARYSATGWVSGGELYLFGGYGYGTNGDFGIRGDLWVYTIPPLALPVSFISFDAKLNNSGSIHLTWLTASEKNNSHFIVLKSTDGINFSELIKISGSGNSDKQNRYQTADKNPANGNNYYQLVQYDTDGKATVLATKVVNANLDKSNSVMVYPNPAQDLVNIKFEKGVFQTIKIIELTGKVLFSKSVDTTQAQANFNIENLPNSIYIINLSGDKRSKNIQFIKK